MVHRLRGTYAEIHLPHLVENCRRLRGLISPDAFFCPMVKANAYGHGDLEVAKALQDSGIENLGVVLVEEGVRLRSAGIVANILVFGTFDAVSASEAMRYDLTPVISSWTQLKTFEEQMEGDAYLEIHIKFNTGMNRLGFEPEDAKKLAAVLAAQSRFQVVGICTHLLNGEDAGLSNGFSDQQRVSFESICKEFSNPKIQVHYLNSSALLMGMQKNVGARPGISIYGIYPPTHKPPPIELKPVLSLFTQIEIIHSVKMGQTVSYGGQWKAPRDSVIGVIPLGYADGYSRAFSNKGVMLCRGEKIFVRGIVCMDYVMVDLTDLNAKSSIGVGETVVVIGEQKKSKLSAQELADNSGTIPYEIVTRLSPRIPRTFIHEH
jgi:alanine racemase